MKTEVSTAVEFVANLIKTGSETVDEQSLAAFTSDVSSQLCRRYHGHWHPENPQRGSGFRCVRCVITNMDPAITEAARKAGITNQLHHLPKELTVWVDPRQVSYRIGEEGSVCNLLDTPNTTFSPNAESWYPKSHSPPSLSTSPTSPQSGYISSDSSTGSISPVSFEARRSPPAHSRKWQEAMVRQRSRDEQRYMLLNASGLLYSSDARIHGDLYSGPTGYRHGRSPSPPLSRAQYNSPRLVSSIVS